MKKDGYKNQITFISLAGDELIFYTERNSLNGKQMWWFDKINGMFAGTLKEAKTIENEIKTNCKVLKEIKNAQK